MFSSRFLRICAIASVSNLLVIYLVVVIENNTEKRTIIIPSWIDNKAMTVALFQHNDEQKKYLYTQHYETTRLVLQTLVFLSFMLEL